MPKPRLHLLVKEDHISNVISDWERGDTTVQIASSHNLNPVVVRKWLREEGVEISRGARPAPIITVVCEVCGDSFSKKESLPRRTCSDKCYHSLLASQKRGVARPDMQTDEWREMVRENSKKMWADGKFENRPWGHRTWPYQGINMRSSFEVAAAKVLDDRGIAWFYEPERFHLSSGTYRPDFFLPELGVWIEIKGWLTDAAAIKFQDFLATGRTAFMVKATNAIGISSQVTGLIEALVTTQVRAEPLHLELEGVK